jgi:hypothetical protein
VEIRGRFRPRYEQVLSEITAARLPFEKSRQRDDAIFHYKVDSLNTVLSIAIDTGTGPKVLFATPQKENLRRCVSAKYSYGRHPLVPLFLLHAKLLQEAGYIQSPEGFLEDLLRRAHEVATVMRGAKSFEEMAKRDVLKVAQLYAEVSLLARGPSRKAGAETAARRPLTTDDMIKVLSQPQRVRQMADELEAQFQKAAAELVGSCAIEDSLAEMGGLADDPVVKKIKAGLNLN